ncbi:hypothetical protein BDV11DRAFT_171259 [Aspergillus similis]
MDSSTHPNSSKVLLISNPLKKIFKFMLALMDGRSPTKTPPHSHYLPRYQATSKSAILSPTTWYIYAPVWYVRAYSLTFDGVALDWEYPGAGDRGGKPEDTENYVLLMKTLRETFDASGNTYGITFTAPSS